MFIRTKKSFGLLEVVIVVAIFLLTLGAVISITGLSYKNLIKNEFRWKALILAQNAIEEQRRLRDNNYLTGSYANPWVGTYCQTILAGCSTYTRCYPISMGGGDSSCTSSYAYKVQTVACGGMVGEPPHPDPLMEGCNLKTTVFDNTGHQLFELKSFLKRYYNPGEV